MGCLLLLSFFIFLFYSLSSSSSSSFCNYHDSSALLLFKNSFPTSEGSSDFCPFSHPRTKSWKNGTDCCEWDGVTCDSISGHVIALDLSLACLKGQLHPNSSIFTLTHLQNLSLAYSGITGDIPSTISHLSKLVSLDLSCSRETRLDLDPYTWNKLIHNATNLRDINLDGVNMSSVGESSLSLLTNLSSSLVSLSLRDTQLHVNFPTHIFCLPNLQILRLSFNENLTGELPKSNCSTPLSFLDLSFTAFSGNILHSIAHFKSLNELYLYECNMGGLLPSSLFNLTQLFYLALSRNNLVGPIPSELHKFPKFQYLYLAGNMLNGTIPRWLISLPSLLDLDLRGNQLTGSIGEFSTYSLEILDLSNNKLKDNFPTSIFQLENLSHLDLSSTNLSGFVDFHQFSKLKNMCFLDLADNRFLTINFNGRVDHIFNNLYKLSLSSSNINFNLDSSAHYMFPSLVYLFLSSCNINSFPKFLAPLQNLRLLYLSNNGIRGSIPKWFRENLLHSWKDIASIDLSFNKLQGGLPIPHDGIKYFLVSNNELTGDISPAFCNASYLRVLNLGFNNLTGLIPQCLETFPFLWVLDLQKNNLYGSIPQNFSEGNALETIKLNGNQLKGPLPRSLAHCTTLKILDLGNNNIEDTFPVWLETLPNLQVLILRSNKFHGVITSFGTKLPFPRLRIFDISNNYFTGPLPESYIQNFQGMMNVNDSQTGLNYMYTNFYYNDSIVLAMKGQYMELVRILTIFTTIDLSNNMFEGELPNVIGELHSLIGLNLSHNKITGTIPLSLGNLRNLEWLDLSWNQLMGEIPMALANLNFLAVFNLSQNQFEGVIPKGGQFNTFGNDSYAGNPMLCGFPLSKSCSKDEEWVAHSIFQHEESGFGWKAVAVGYACGVVFGILLGYKVFMTGKPNCFGELLKMC